MGQKVNPIGFRLGITRSWDSRWMFPDKKSFRNSLIEDIKIREGIMNKFKFAIVTQVEIERAINKIVIIIHAVKPGMIIGRGGKGMEEVKKFVVDTIGGDKIEREKIKIDISRIEPVKKPYLNAYYVAYDIASKLMRSFPHRIAVHQALDRVKEAGAKGVKIQLSGRIGGASIGRREKYYSGVNHQRRH